MNDISEARIYQIIAFLEKSPENVMLKEAAQAIRQLLDEVADLEESIESLREELSGDDW